MKDFGKILVHFAALLLVLLPQVALAHGGGTAVLTQVEAGPYWVYVFTEPATPQAGSAYHVTVAVTQPQSDGSETAVEGAEIVVRFVPASGETITKNATPSAAGPGYYETDTVLPTGGAWTVQVDVESPLGAGSVEYQVEAQAAGGLSWGWIGAGVALIIVGLGLFAYAFTKRGTKDTQGAVVS